MVRAIVPDGAERRAPRPVTEPVRIRALHPATDRLRRLERLGIQDELARGIGAEEDVAAGRLARSRSASPSLGGPLSRIEPSHSAFG
jgi:hypothetical protein